MGGPHGPMIWAYLLIGAAYFATILLTEQLLKEIWKEWFSGHDD